MGFFFGRGRGKKIPANASFRITQEGREKLQHYTGDPRSQILMALETQGASCDIDELSQATGMSRGQIERTMLRLIPQFVQLAGAGDYVEGVSE